MEDDLLLVKTKLIKTKVRNLQSKLKKSIELNEKVIEQFEKRELSFIKEVVHESQKQGWYKLLTEEIQQYNDIIKELKS